MIMYEARLCVDETTRIHLTTFRYIRHILGLESEKLSIFVLQDPGQYFLDVFLQHCFTKMPEAAKRVGSRKN